MAPAASRSGWRPEPGRQRPERCLACAENPGKSTQFLSMVRRPPPEGTLGRPALSIRGGDMRQTYRVLGYLIAIGVVVQAAAIAAAWFLTINDIDDGLVVDKDYDGNWGHALHGMVGMMVIPL